MTAYRSVTVIMPIRNEGAFIDRSLGAVIDQDFPHARLQILVAEDDERLTPAFEALTAAVERGRIRRLALERVDGEPVVGSRWEAQLIELGFRAGPRKLTIGA